ncbi:MAG: hypothetical protein ABEJ83_03580 [Candidatus Nanohaloarchaea archaeon]
MDKTLALIVGAAVVMILGMTAAVMFSQAIKGVDQGTDNVRQDSSCNYQINQYCRGNAEAAQLDSKCLKYIPKNCREGDTGELLKARFGEQLT